VTLVEPRLRDVSGAVLPAPAGRWFRPADATEQRALAGAVGPVLDVGCGPGRHVFALAERGIPVLGIDITDHALAHARARSIPVLERCVFGHVPGAGRWRSALLLDGNIGIGGDPAQLVRRIRELLADAGRILVELDPPGTASHRTRVRLEVDDEAGPWFDWARVGVDDLDALAASTGTCAARPWHDDGRWFVWLGA
jgi:SAM-dependent methyltransferase